MGDIDVLEGKRAVVTGGAGVIGQELLKLLTRKGAVVLSLDRRPLSLSNWGGTHARIDLAEESLDVLQDFNPHVLFHLAAAFERSKESATFWGTNWHDNVVLSHRIVELAKELPGLSTFVFASSYLLYEPSLYLSTVPPVAPRPLREDDRLEPRNVTGAAKLYTEKELQFIKEYCRPSLRVINARIYRVYGCGSKDVISRWVRAALAGEPLEVYNKENRFDFIYAGDVADGLVKLAESPRAEGPVNLGSGVAHSIQDMLEAIAKRVPVETRDHGATEQFEASRADTTRLESLTGWTPLTDLERGVEIVFEFERDAARRGKAHGT